MKFSKLGLINKNQRGFTLIELVIAFAVGSIITSGITATFYQIVTGTTRSDNHVIAVAQVQNAGYWISHDAQMAQSIIFDDPATSGVTEFLTLTWIDWETNDVQRVAYTFVDIPGSGFKNLQRILTSGGTEVEAGIIARSIDPASTATRCELTGGGTFSLPDSGDSFIITGGAVDDSGTIIKISGSISVTTSGSATYISSTGAWTVLAGSGNTITVTASGTTSPRTGTWSATTASATVALTADSDNDAAVTCRLFTLTVTASVGAGAQGHSETRVYRVSPRPSS